MQFPLAPKNEEKIVLLLSANHPRLGIAAGERRAVMGTKIVVKEGDASDSLHDFISEGRAALWS
jgi:hypothetical protein